MHHSRRRFASGISESDSVTRSRTCARRWILSSEVSNAQRDSAAAQMTSGVKASHPFVPSARGTHVQTSLTEEQLQLEEMKHYWRGEKKKKEVGGAGWRGFYRKEGM